MATGRAKEGVSSPIHTHTHTHKGPCCWIRLPLPPPPPGGSLGPRRGQAGPGPSGGGAPAVPGARLCWAAGLLRPPRPAKERARASLAGQPHLGKAFIYLHLASF